MKKLVIPISIIAVTASAFFGSAAQAQSGDPCGGTGGNGEIVSRGDTGFTLRLNEGGQKGGGTLFVTLAGRATIETSAGRGSVSDLKIGDRVTLVGDNHRDGTFSADTVVVCSGTSEMRAGGEATDRTGTSAVQNRDPGAYERVHGIMTAVTILVVGLIWLGMVFFLRKKGKGVVHMFFFTIFYIYVYKVLDITLFQFQSLLLLQHFVPGLMLNGFTEGTNVNLIPLVTLTSEDLKTSLLNILMMMPFGFGLPFVTNLRFKGVVIAGFAFSVVIELAQLVTGFMASTTFRVADVNDLIFNTVGVAIGYVLFAQFVLVLRRVVRTRSIRGNPVVRYMAERPIIDKRTS